MRMDFKLIPANPLTANFSSFQEELLEGMEVVGHGDGLLLALHEGGEAGGDFHVGVADVVHYLLELGWVCGFQEEAYLAGAKAVLQCLVSAGTMGVELVARLAEALAHGGGNLLVGVCGTGDVLGDGLVAMAIEVQDAGKVAGVAHVHGIGDGGGGGTGIVAACLQVVVEDVVGIVGGNEAVDGQAHATAEEGAADVAEVARGHTSHQFGSHGRGGAIDGNALLLQLGVCPEVVEALGEEACHVDGVGRGEFHVEVEFLVHEGALHHCLAIVEDTVHLDGGDVLSQGGELALLDGRDLALGVEHVDVDAGDAKETVGHGRTGVAGGGNKDIDLRSSSFLLGITQTSLVLLKLRASVYKAVSSLLLVEIAQQAGHEACAHVLEGQCGAVEEFQGVDIVRYLYGRDGERHGVVDNLAQVLGRDVLAEEALCHTEGDFLKRHVLDVVEELLWQGTDTGGHIKATVGGKTLDNGGFKALASGGIVG